MECQVKTMSNPQFDVFFNSKQVFNEEPYHLKAAISG